MIDHAAVLVACRARLATLSVASVTGTIAGTATGYSRSTGSFLTDGFHAGMEVVGSGFSEPDNNGRRTITSATALTLTCPDTAAETAGSRTLSIGLPNLVTSENVAAEDDTAPVQDEPYFEEEYVPGAGDQITISPSGELEYRPLYLVRIRVPQDTGVLGIWGYARAVMALFRPGTALTVTDHTVAVMRNPAPFAGQLQIIGSYAVMLVTIPLRVRVSNV